MTVHDMPRQRWHSPWGAVKKFFTYNDVKAGVLVGTDKAGNKYFEDKKAVQFGRWEEVCATTKCACVCAFSSCMASLKIVSFVAGTC